METTQRECVVHLSLMLEQRGKLCGTRARHDDRGRMTALALDACKQAVDTGGLAAHDNKFNLSVIRSRNESNRPSTLCRQSKTTCKWQAC